MHNAQRTRLLAMLLFAACASSLYGDGAARPESVRDQSTDEKAVRAVLDEWLDALRHNDMAALERTIAPDYAITVSGGRVLSRDEDLEVIKNGKVRFHTVDVDSVNVKMLGVAAVVTGVGRYTVTMDEKTSAIRERFTVIFAKRQGRWQPVASHTTPLRAAGGVPAATQRAATADSAAIAAARAALAAGNAEYIRAFGSGDAAGVAAVYAPDGSRMAPQGKVLTGRAAIRDDITRFIANAGPVLVTIDSRELWLVGDMAYESGNWSYTFTPAGKAQTRIAGRFVTSWKRQPGGAWRIYADIGLSE